MSSESLETRKRIIKTTLKLLESGQGSAVRMSDIAKSVGISRQAVYLHFENRVDLLVATTYYLDEIHNIESQIKQLRQLKSGEEKLIFYIEAWGQYLPKIYGLAKALLAMSETDKEAAMAWRKRMQDMKEGCAAVVKALEQDKKLSSDFSCEQATAILWTLLSVKNWEQFTQECGFSQKKYIETIKLMAKRLLLSA